MDIIEYFLNQHAWGHAAAVSGAQQPTTADRLIDGLSDDQMRSRPAASANSIAWVLWHMARIEDATVGVLIGDRQQVLESGGWIGRLGVEIADVGTGMADTEVIGLSERIDLRALIEYRSAVGRRTREIARSLPASALMQRIDAPRVQRLAGSVISSSWLLQAWQGQTVGFLLSMPASGHNFLHIGEAWCVRALLGAGGGR